MKFDVVVGNPPYQMAKGTSTNNSTLWDKIAIECFSLLSDGGYIAFVTPQSWMRPNHKILSWFKQHELHNVSTTVGRYFPGINSTFCYWIASNNESSGDMIIDDVPLNIKKVLYLVPQKLLSIHKKVIFANDNCLSLVSDQVTAHTEKLSPKSKRFSDTLSKEKNSKCVYPIFHTNAQEIYSSIKTKNFDDKKVMFTDSGYFKPRYDSGKLGSSQRCHYFLVSSRKQGDILTTILSSPVYQFIVKTAKWSGFSDLRVLRSLPSVDLSRSWSDNELYKHFKLTKEEIQLIEDTIK